VLPCKWRDARANRLLLCVLGSLLPLSAAAPVHAYEDQVTLGLALGYAHATDTALPHPGASAGVEASLGLGVAWSVRAAASYSLHPGDVTLHHATLGAELVYIVDVLEFVPYAGVGIDALGHWTHAAFDADFGAHPVVGIDWLPNRELGIGLCVRPIIALTELKNAPLYLSIALNASWHPRR
jgi:hypothetical protein